MKITPAKDYKKPLYAIGLATAILAASVTGCTDPDSKSKSRRHNHRTKHTEVQLAGEAQTVETDIEYGGETEVYTDPTTSEDLQIEGEMTVWTEPTDDDLRIDGGVQICPDYEVDGGFTGDGTDSTGET